MQCILIVGEYRQAPAEGMQVVTSCLVNYYKTDPKTAIDTVEVRRVFSCLPKILKFSPHTIVFTHGPGAGALIVSRVLKILTRARIIFVATKPALEKVPRLIQSLAAVNHILYGGDLSKLGFLGKRKSITLHEVVIGIDPTRLSDSSDQKIVYRNQFLEGGGHDDKKVLLHVGHIRANRGLHRLAEIQKKLADRVAIVMVGSPALEVDKTIVSALTDAGVRVVVESIGDMAALYKSADAYIFPVEPGGGAVDLPLSVVEAIACGLPVVSTEFGSLRKRLNHLEYAHFFSLDEFVEGAVDLVVTDALFCGTGSANLPKEFDLRCIAEFIKELA